MTWREVKRKVKFACNCGSGREETATVRVPVYTCGRCKVEHETPESDIRRDSPGSSSWKGPEGWGTVRWHRKRLLGSEQVEWDICPDCWPAVEKVMRP